MPPWKSRVSAREDSLAQAAACKQGDFLLLGLLTQSQLLVSEPRLQCGHVCWEGMAGGAYCLLGFPRALWNPTTLEPSFYQSRGSSIHQDKRKFWIETGSLCSPGCLPLRLRVMLSLYSCLHLPSAEVVGLHHHDTWFCMWPWGWNPALLPTKSHS